MAMLKFGHGLRGIKGKRSGNIYRRDTHCHHVQAFPRLVNRWPSTTQQSQRKYFTQCQSAWSALPALEYHVRWLIYSRMHPITNKLGEFRILPARLKFFSVNMKRLADSEAIINDPPF